MLRRPAGPRDGSCPRKGRRGRGRAAGGRTNACARRRMPGARRRTVRPVHGARGAATCGSGARPGSLRPSPGSGGLPGPGAVRRRPIRSDLGAGPARERRHRGGGAGKTRPVTRHPLPVCDPEPRLSQRPRVPSGSGAASRSSAAPGPSGRVPRPGAWLSGQASAGRIGRCGRPRARARRGRIGRPGRQRAGHPARAGLPSACRTVPSPAVRPCAVCRARLPAGQRAVWAAGTPGGPAGWGESLASPGLRPRRIRFKNSALSHSGSRGGGAPVRRTTRSAEGTT